MVKNIGKSSTYIGVEYYEDYNEYKFTKLESTVKN